MTGEGLQLLLLCGGIALLSSGDPGANKTLDIYFIDTEGGAATLIVTPLGESLLVDSGYPGERDAGRIAQVAQTVAGLARIDHYITTHWHRDHFGGIAELAKLIPVDRYYDHGLPKTLPSDIDPGLVAAYREASKGRSMRLEAGDQIKLRKEPSMPSLRLHILAADGLVVNEPQGPSQVRTCNKGHNPKPPDVSDNAKSIAYRLTFGAFKFFAGGDLTWNVEHKLACPTNIAGAVDLYLVNHHGLDSSNNPALVQALNPRVAVINNGARKGSEAGTFRTLKKAPGLEAIFQLHRNVRVAERENAPFAFIANDELCRGDFIKLSVSTDGRSYSLSIPAKSSSYTFRTK